MRKVLRLGEKRRVRVIESNTRCALVEWPACEDNGFLAFRWWHPLEKAPTLKEAMSPMN